MARPELKISLLVALLLSATTAAAAIPDEVKRALAARDYETAVQWLEANSAEPDAAFELGRLHRLGRGVAKDEAASLAYLSQAAAAGHVEAQYMLGRHCEKTGQLGEARMWMAKAAAAGHGKAASWSPRVPDVQGSLLDWIRAGRRPPESISRMDANGRDGSGRTPLMAAVEAGSIEWLTALTEAGADPDAADRHGTTALHRAVIADRSEMVELLLGAGANSRVANSQMDTPLHLAVASGSVAIARSLLNSGADPAVEDAAGWSAADLARRSADPELLAAFRIKGQAMAAGSREVDDPEVLQRRLSDAALRGNLAAVDELLEQPSFDPAWPALNGLLIRLADDGSVAVLERLVAAGVPAGRSDERGRTALHAGSSAGCSGCVHLLVKSGSALDGRDGLGRTPLVLAARAGSRETAEILLDAGADSGAVDQNGRNPLWWALKSGNVDAALVLLTRGVPLAADSEGVHPLHLAASADLPNAVEALMGKVPVDEPTRDGNSALLLAAGTGAEQSVRVLLANGGAIGFRNPQGDTALIIATRAGHLETARALLEAGANPSTRNERFESAASIVAERGDADWEALLAEHRRGVFDLLGAL